MWPVVLLIAVALAAAFVLATTGFGFGLFSIPFLMALVDPREAVVLSLLFSLIITSAMLARREVRQSIRFSLVIPLFVCSLPGLPIGAYLLQIVDGRLLRVGTCLLVVAASAFLVVRGGARRENGRLAVAAVGFTSGLLATSTSLSGTPVALFATTERLSKHDFRSSLAAYSWLNILLSLATLGASGMVLDQTLVLAGVALPALLVGYWCGTRFFGRLSHSRFSQLIPLVTVVAGAVGLVTTFW
ncbi:MAG: sulfite exporter TauE/SafE family protein [Chloroflexota bacterium]